MPVFIKIENIHGVVVYVNAAIIEQICETQLASNEIVTKVWIKGGDHYLTRTKSNVLLDEINYYTNQLMWHLENINHTLRIQ